MKITGIYEIVHIVSGCRYVGSSVYVGKRWRQHRRDLQRSAHHCEHLQRAWNKYGADAFVFRIIEECPVDQLIMHEQHHVNQMPVNLRFNSFQPTDSLLGFKHSPETKQSIRVGVAALWTEPEYRTNQVAKARARDKAPLRSAQAKRWTDPDQRTAQSALATSQAADPELCAAKSAKVKAKWADPEWRAANIARIREGKRKEWGKPLAGDAG